MLATMGCVSDEKNFSLPVWSRHRHLFPVTEQYIYLNHAAVAPLSLPAADAMRGLADDCLRHGANHYDAWLETYDAVRAGAARLIGADKGEIAIAKNTSEGISTVALGIDWRPGDRVVAFREEFPANMFPWLRLEQQGVRLDWLSITDPLDRIDAACRGARLLAVSFVNYLTGYRVDLEAIGEICRRHGTFFFVDAIQGLGVFPLDVRRASIDALAADGHKWLLGPEGCAILFVRQDLQDAVTPAAIGWTNFAHYADYASRDMTWRPDAGRYESGTLNTIGIYGLRAAIDLVLEVGVAEIAPHVQSLADSIAAGVAAKGYELAVPRTPTTGAGIVSFRKEGTDARALVRSLRDKNICAAPRQGWVRVSPHFYISPDDVAQFLENVSA
jgi:cysteine desulfurase / selenocysteine lyase